MKNENFMTIGEVITLLIILSGLVLGVHWFGWWFLVPAILLKTKVT